MVHSFTDSDDLTNTPALLKRYSLQTGPHERLKAKLLRTLGRVFATTLRTKRLYRASDADGVQFLEKLIDLAKTATPGDEAVLQAKLDEHIRVGIPGQLSEPSVSAWKDVYDLLVATAPMPPTAANEVFIIGKMVMKHPEVHRDYALSTRGAAKPKTMDEAIDVRGYQRHRVWRERHGR